MSQTGKQAVSKKTRVSDGEGASVAKRATDASRAKVNNIGPANIQSGGVDFITLSMWGKFDGNYRNVIRELKDAQDAARLSSEDHKHEIGEFTCFSKVTGGRGAGTYFRYHFETEGIHILIREQADTRSSRLPTIQVRASGNACLMHGIGGVRKIVNQLFKEIGFEESQNRVNRVDVCADVLLPLEALVKAHDEDRLISRATKVITYVERTAEGKRYETLQLGTRKAGCHCRMYDKIEETRYSEHKREMMRVHRWGELPENATRVEFEMSGAWLNEQLSIDTFETLCQQMKTLCHYLTHEWMRIAGDPVDRRVTTRSKVSEEWSVVQEAFELWTTGKRHERTKRRPMAITAEKLLKQTIGTLETYFATIGVIPDTPMDMVKYTLKEIIDQYESFKENIRGKRDVFRSKNGGRAFQLYPIRME